MIWLLLGCLVLSVGVFLERLSYFHRAGMNVGEFLAGLASLIRRKNFAEALQECVATRVPVGRVIHAALLRHNAPREHLKEIVQEAGQLEVPRLERYLSILHAIAHAAPLIGLLGTIMGLLDCFTHLSAANGVATPTDLARGVYSSLITSGFSIAVAIPAHAGYNYLVSRVNKIVLDMERAAAEIVNIVTENGNGK